MFYEIKPFTSKQRAKPSELTEFRLSEKELQQAEDLILGMARRQKTIPCSPSTPGELKEALNDVSALLKKLSKRVKRMGEEGDIFDQLYAETGDLYLWELRQREMAQSGLLIVLERLIPRVDSYAIEEIGTRGANPAYAYAIEYLYLNFKSAFPGRNQSAKKNSLFYRLVEFFLCEFTDWKGSDCSRVVKNSISLIEKQNRPL